MISLLLLFSLNSQPGCLHLTDTVLPRNKNYKVKLINQDAQVISGYLAGFDDSTIRLAGVPLPKRGALQSGIITNTYQYPNIASLQLERKGILERSVLWGTGIGLGVGVMAGFASGDDPRTPETGEPIHDAFSGLNDMFDMTAGEKAFIYGLTCAATGSLIGILAGVLSKKKFLIKGKKENFDAMRNALLSNTPANPSTNSGAN